MSIQILAIITTLGVLIMQALHIMRGEYCRVVHDIVFYAAGFCLMGLFRWLRGGS